MNLISETLGCTLLTLARKSIIYGKSSTPTTPTNFGIFITLYVCGKERGCVGNPNPRGSFEELVQDCAIFAATKDPRYPKIKEDEYSSLEILLSILTPPKATYPNEVQIGTHGLIVTQDNLSALHLPHVALENGWNIETLLQKTCLKGGLQKDAWKTGAEIKTFETQRFFEDPRTKKIPPKRNTIPPM